LAIDTNPSSSANFSISLNDPSLSVADWLSQFSTLYSGLSDDAAAGFFFGLGVNGDSPIVDLIYGSQDNPTPSASSWLGQFIAANGLQLGTGTRNPATGVYNGYSFGDLYAEGGGNTTIYMPVYWLKQFYQQFIVPNTSTLQAAFPCSICAPGTPGAPVTAYTKPLIRTGTGSIDVAASGSVDLTNGPTVDRQTYDNGSLSGQATNTFQVGGTSIYTAGHPVEASAVAVTAPDTGEIINVQIGNALAGMDNFTNQNAYSYGITTNKDSVPGILIANPDYLTGGGNISIAAGNSVLGRRDDWLTESIGQGISLPPNWVGPVDEPWRTGGVGAQTSAAIDPQLFTEGIATLGGGDIIVTAGVNVSDLSVAATDSMVTATAVGATRTTAALAVFGGGNVHISAGMDILGGQVDVASGEGLLNAGHDIASAGSFINVDVLGSGSAQPIDNLLTLRLTDATIQVSANGSIDMQGITSLGVRQQNLNTQQQLSNRDDAFGLYSPRAGVDLLANGDVTVVNDPDNTILNDAVVYPGSFVAAALTGNLTVNNPTGVGIGAVLLMPSASGQLQLLAGGNIAPATIAMLDADPGLLPGPFSIYASAAQSFLGAGVPFSFPALYPSSSDSQRSLQHAQIPTHINDPEPVRIAAGIDIGTDKAGLTLSVPKQARISAGEDILNMMFFGQNLAPSDITRIVAGRDIIGTTTLVTPVLDQQGDLGVPLPTLLGNSFVIGGPGSFILQAGRNAGPFLNSATVSSLTGANAPYASTEESYGGGILSVGNEWNPWLPSQGANISVLFGTGRGIDYDGFQEAYLDPANLGSMPAYLFAQQTITTVAGGVTAQTAAPDRSKPVYAPLLIQWMQENAPAQLVAAYGTADVTYAQAYAAFAVLPALNRQAFLNQIYFDELKTTAIPDDPSYHQYGRGYQAVDTLFPASLGYTQNDLTGGTNGANQSVETGNLDLRLATIQTEWGGDITIMGPGGRVLAGSTVSTSAQAARRAYVGRALDTGYLDLGTPSLFEVIGTNPHPTSIEAIPSGYEGVLTLRGGSISTFTDGDFLLNQSRLFTEQGGDIIMWSSNADLNAGQGPKTSANFPPVLVRVDQNLYSELDQSGATTGAGIAALQATPDSPPSDVYLIAPRGTVDAGAAGVRVSGDLFVAALAVANADNFQVQGHAFGVPTAVVVDTSATLAASNTSAAAAQAAVGPSAQATNTDLPSIITVEVLGYGGTDEGDNDNNGKRRNSQ
jgi:hypothetical protein